ncbi:TnsD family transposase [Yersinia ruckeri]|uniref:Transposition protein, TnsD-related protein n=7 Tax=Yersinia ruckeri TaxID=29486 RepID=A0A0A8VD77_YERRU|nr:TnsD family Tn7-like transposition protein [Yersinia ruckeri]KGA44047.1 tniQ family protein [Yersinia ruckeri ATCC 29473]MCK8594826.1 TnsD family transposase [Yersinia ruckeri]MCK8597820.1 TnsD family transposase [Yersinia ruckeri]MCW6618842.1 TnsD family transposase [Yersinia ruckeri]MCW6630906.1 TnsD family transposase [Yersinia ruckeri]
MQLPQALPDESLFSRLCRHLAVNGINTSQYLNVLLANSRVTIHPYLTSDLGRISVFCDESAEQLSMNQTLICLFSYYLPNYASIINDPASSAHRLIRACQLAAYRNTENLDIKYCSKCAENEMKNYGVTYWHCSHQIPGVEACHQHKIWLEHIGLPGRTHIAAWLLPPSHANSSCCCTPLATQFALYSEHLLSLIRTGTLPEKLDYRTRMFNNNFVTINGRIRRKPLASKLFEIAQQLFPSINHLKPKAADDYAYWASAFAGKMNQHPFKYLLLDFCLEIQTQDNPVSIPLTLTQRDVTLEQRCCNLLYRGISMENVGLQIGKSRCYVKTVALKYNIPVKLKPKKITENIKLHVIQLARKGFHRKEIARRFNISKGSVEIIISTTSGLVDFRKKCKFESKRRSYKCQIIRFIQNNPYACRQDIKRYCSNAFFWLYQRCPAWLECHLPAVNKPKCVIRVDWAIRDKILSKEVAFIIEEQGGTITRTQLDRILGGHGWLTKNKKRLPLTLDIFSRLTKEIDKVNIFSE